MVTEKQTVNVKAPDGYRLKTEGIFEAADLIFLGNNWISGNKFALMTRYSFIGRPISLFKVYVAEEEKRIIR